MTIHGLRLEHIEKEYTLNKDVFSEDGIMLKILNELSVDDRRLIILYAELNSLRAIARILDCSHVLLFYKIQKIRKYFYSRLKDLNVNGKIIVNDN